MTPRRLLWGGLALALATLAVTGGRWLAPSPRELAEWQLRAGAGRDENALAHLETLARLGNVAAQRLSGEVLALSRPPQALPKAMAWLDRAAANGDAEASFILGKLYFRGREGLAQDWPQAYRHFEQAVQHGDAQAAYYLGVMRKGGYGVSRDDREAVRWWQIAAAAGAPAAQFMLANAYRYGDGVARDEAQALALYRSAAEEELPEAVQTMAMAYHEGALGLRQDDMQYRHYVLETAHSLKHPATAP